MEAQVNNVLLCLKDSYLKLEKTYIWFFLFLTNPLTVQSRKMFALLGLHSYFYNLKKALEPSGDFEKE